MRFVYLGRDLFAPCLAALLDAGHTPVAIQTTHPPGETLSEQVHRIARRWTAPVGVGHVGPEQMRDWARLAPDVLICAGWPRRLPEPAQFGLRGINVHPSLLPEGRGPWPLPHVILKRKQRTGVTVHRLVADFDAGPVLRQVGFAVPSWFDLDVLLRVTRRKAAGLLLECLADFDRLWTDATPQGTGSWWPRLTRAEQTIDWTANGSAILRRMRAFGSDGVYAEIEGEECRLMGCDLIQQVGAAGAIIRRDGRRLWVGTGDAVIECIRL